MESEKNLFDNRTKERIDQLYLMSEWVRNLIEIDACKRGLLGSSLFINVCYTAETITSIDWNTTVKKLTLQLWDANSEEAQDPTSAMKAMLLFGYAQLGSKAPEEFSRRLLAKGLRTVDDIIAILEDLDPDTYDFQELRNFRTRFEIVMKNQDLSLPEHFDLVFRMVRFVYSVRNNIFRGYTLAPIINQDSSVQIRLQIYSRVLMAVCRLLFSTLEQTGNWKPQITKFRRPQYEYYMMAVDKSRLRNQGRKRILDHRK